MIKRTLADLKTKKDQRPLQCTRCLNRFDNFEMYQSHSATSDIEAKAAKRELTEAQKKKGCHTSG